MSSYEDPQNAIRTGGQSLGPVHRFPWYDAGKDDLHRMEVVPTQPSTSPHAGGALNSLGFWAVLAILALVAAVVVVALLRAARLPKSAGRNRGPAMVIGEAERIEALPFRVARANLSLLDQARNFYQAGNYASAMIYLFSHQLVQLDRHQVIRLSKGKTNRQYLREVGQAELLRQLIGQTLVAFEDVFFGHHEIDRQRFEACWSRLPEFDSLLAQGPPSAA